MDKYKEMMKIPKPLMYIFVATWAACNVALIYIACLFFNIIKSASNG